MSLDFYIEIAVDTGAPERERFVLGSHNVTHNLNKMADEAGIYKCLWRPEEIGVTHAHQMIPLLETGLALLESDPDRFKAFNPDNGWGDYDGLVQFVYDVLRDCQMHPKAEIRAWR